MITKFVQELLNNDAATSHFGIVVETAADGFARGTVEVSDSMTNGHGLAHGGVAFALADTIFACATNSVRQGVVTTNASISYLKAAQVGQLLSAEGTVVFHEQRALIADVVIKADGATIAMYRGSGLSLKRDQ